MNNQRGFTLLEMMVVVAIVAILAALLIPNFTHARAQAQTAACESNLHVIATALELYYTDHEQYPTAASAVTIGTNTGTANAGDLLEKDGYLNSVPHDPAAAAGTTYSYKTQAASGSTSPAYTISCPGTHDPTTLTQVPGSTATSTQLFYNSGSGLSSAAAF